MKRMLPWLLLSLVFAALAPVLPANASTFSGWHWSPVPDLNCSSNCPTVTLTQPASDPGSWVMHFVYGGSDYTSGYCSSNPGADQYGCESGQIPPSIYRGWQRMYLVDQAGVTVLDTDDPSLNLDASPSPSPSATGSPSSSPAASASTSPSASGSPSASSSATDSVSSDPSPSSSVASSPSPSASPSSSPSASSAAAGAVTVAGLDDLAQEVQYGLALLVFLSAATFVLAWKR